MKELPRQVLIAPRERNVSVAAVDLANQDYWMAKLIEPNDAVQWIATGQFYFGAQTHGTDGPILDWWTCTADYSLESYALEEGHLDLARELATEAIEYGRLRLFFVIPAVNPLYTSFNAGLEVALPEQFAGHLVDIESDEDDGRPTVRVSAPSDPDDELAFKGFFFLWSEVQGLRPRYTRRPPPSETMLPVDTSSPAESLHDDRPKRRRGKARGRRPADHGTAMIEFVAQMQSQGLTTVAQYGAESLGRELITVYERLGMEPPHPDNAGRWASGAIKAAVAHLADANPPE